MAVINKIRIDGTEYDIGGGGSGGGLEVVTELPENPVEGQLVVYNGEYDHEMPEILAGHIYQYIPPLYAWRITEGYATTYIYTRDYAPDPTKSTTVYKSDNTPYVREEDDPSYEIMTVSGDSMSVERDSQGDTSTITATKYYQEDIILGWNGWNDILVDYISNANLNINGSVNFGEAEGDTPYYPTVKFNDKVEFNEDTYFNTDSADKKVYFDYNKDSYIDGGGNANLYSGSFYDLSANELTLSGGLHFNIYPSTGLEMNGKDINGVINIKAEHSDMGINIEDVNITGSSVNGNIYGNIYTDQIYVNESGDDSIAVNNDFDMDNNSIKNINNLDTNSLTVTNIYSNESGNTPLIHIKNNLELGANNISNVSKIYGNELNIGTIKSVSSGSNITVSNNTDFNNNNIINVNNIKSPKMGYAEYFKALKASNVVPYRFVKITERNSDHIELSQADGSNPYIGISTTNAMIVGNSNQAVTSSEEKILVGLIGSFWIDIYEDEDIVSGDFVAPEDGGYASKTTHQSYPQVIKVDSVNNKCLVLLK